MAQTSETRSEDVIATPDQAEPNAPETADPISPKAENLDDFFDQGEEQAKKGSSCSKPAEPVA